MTGPFIFSCCSSLFTCKSLLLGVPEPSCNCIWPSQYLGCFGCFSYRVIPVSLSLHQDLFLLFRHKSYCSILIFKKPFTPRYFMGRNKDVSPMFDAGKTTLDEKIDMVIKFIILGVSIK